MSLFKKIFKNSGVQSILAWIAAHYLKFVYATSKWHYEGEQHILHYISNNKPCIYAFWHNRLMMCPFTWRYNKPFYMLISGHSDGRLISETIKYFNIKTIVGSKSKGGLGALKNILMTLKNGNYVGITPDGPRGPRFVVSKGMITIARLSKCDIVPVCYSIQRRKILNSWDRFIIPLPFSHGILAWGPPIKIQNDKDIPLIKQISHLNNEMMKLANSVDDFCNQERLY